LGFTRRLAIGRRLVLSVDQTTDRRCLDQCPAAELEDLKPTVADHCVDRGAAKAQNPCCVVYGYCERFHRNSPARLGVPADASEHQQVRI
jgi:hypothetical protein